MQVTTRILAFVLALPAGALPLMAQTDYRNLDDHRPVRTEDAYPIERYAFELVVPYAFEREAGGGDVHLVTPELSYGVARNTQVGLELPLAAVTAGGGTDWGFAGPRVSALYNFNTEAPALPAFALGGRLALPLGDLGPDDVQFTLEGVATRSWGLTRLHLDAAVTLGPDDTRGVVAPAPDWAVTAAADHTLLRQSVLLVGELGVIRAGSGLPTEVSAAVGARLQFTPTVVLDAGLARRLTAHAGPDLGVTVGLSHTFALAGLMPRGER